MRNRENKKALCHYLSDYWISQLGSILNESQRFVTAGGFTSGLYVGKAVVVEKEGTSFWYSESNHEESDTRVWLHARKTTHADILIYSPDTDVYHIGLGISDELKLAKPGTQDSDRHKHVVVQLKHRAEESEFLDLNKLVISLQNDPKFNRIPSEHIARFMLVSYVFTGCDQISYLAHCTKRKVIDLLQRHGDFIWNGTNDTSDFLQIPGPCQCDATPNMCDNCREKTKSSACGFFRFIGSFFFDICKHLLGEYETPSQMFRAVCGNGAYTYESYVLWLSKFNWKAFARGQDESWNLPTAPSLLYHWMRVVWLLKIWGQACQVTTTVPACNSYGWSIENGAISVVWDTQDNFRTVQHELDELTRSCGCKTGCKTRRCMCKGGTTAKFCSTLCRCINCENRSCDVTRLTDAIE